MGHTNNNTTSCGTLLEKTYKEDWKGTFYSVLVLSSSSDVPSSASVLLH